MRFLILSICILLINCSQLFSQNLGNIQRGQRGYTPPPQTRPAGEPAPPDVYLLSQQRADMYQEILQIDDFQKEVLKTFLKDYYQKTSDIGFNPDLKFEDKQKGINAEKKILEKTLSDVFTADQVQTIMSEEEFGSKIKKLEKEKRKEKRKKKKNKN